MWKIIPLTELHGASKNKNSCSKCSVVEIHIWKTQILKIRPKSFIKNTAISYLGMLLT